MVIDYKEVDIQREEHVVLYNVNLQVHEGEFVYLTGVVGSGKSSLLKTIYGELDIHTGSAEVLGRNMRRIRRRKVPALRREMGIVFQDFRLLTDCNVRQNLDFVLKATGWKNRSERADRISEVLQIVGLSDKLEAMPFELSGGEQQRVCIARAILNRPKLILADEATGNQDTQSGLHTTQILHNLSKEGTAVIMATHNTLLLEQFPGTVYECRDNRLRLVDEDTGSLPEPELEPLPEPEPLHEPESEMEGETEPEPSAIVEDAEDIHFEEAEDLHIEDEIETENRMEDADKEDEDDIPIAIIDNNN